MANKAVFCIAQSQQQATRIVEEAQDAGFSGDDVSVLLPDRGGWHDFAHEQHTKAPEGATTGAVTGGVLGQPPGIWSVSVRSPVRV